MKSNLFFKKITGVCLTAFFTLLFTSCHDDHNQNTGSYDVIYVQTNDFNGNGNAILAYRHNINGNLEQIPGSPFSTGGSGIGNPMQILGPSDSDDEINRSADGKFLLTVNSGSNTIAVFEIHGNGSLTPVAGSPFPSGGETPVSIDVSGQYVYVVNKSQNPLHPTITAPNYTTFTIDGSGMLTPVAGAKFETTIGSSPSQVLASTDHHLVFGDDFLGFMLSPAVGTLRSFTSDNGLLTPTEGSPYILPNGPMPPDNGALGLYQHPSGNPLYVGMPLQGKVGVFSIDNSTGALNLQTTAMAGKAACWLLTNHSGNRLYVLNSGDNNVQVFNTDNPMSPVSLQTIELKNSGPTYTLPNGLALKTSEDFSFKLSTDEKKMYVVCQHTNTDFSIGNYNYLHVLNVGSDGTLTEPSDPLQLPVPNTVRPKGSLVVSRD